MSPLVRRKLTQHILSTGSTITFMHTMGVPPSEVRPDDVILGPLDGEAAPEPPLPPVVDAPPAPFPTAGDLAAAALAIVSGSVREALPQITALDGSHAPLLDAIEAAERERGAESGEVRKTILSAVAQQRGQVPPTPDAD